MTLKNRVFQIRSELSRKKKKKWKKKERSAATIPQGLDKLLIERSCPILSSSHFELKEILFWIRTLRMRTSFQRYTQTSFPPFPRCLYLLAKVKITVPSLADTSLTAEVGCRKPARPRREVSSLSNRMDRCWQLSVFVLLDLPCVPSHRINRQRSIQWVL